ncbi:hypothetical protein ACFV2X_20760 [Streptomyces sp. NPDC059679]
MTRGRRHVPSRDNTYRSGDNRLIPTRMAIGAVERPTLAAQAQAKAEAEK